MFHYIYKITKLSTSEYYIGKRSSSFKCEDDPYMGSGIWIRKECKDVSKMNKIPDRAYKKYLNEDYVKTLLEYVNCVKDIDERESFYISDKWINDDLCLNRTPGGIGSMYGKENLSFDKNIYEWKKENEETLYMTQYEFRNYTNISQSNISSVVNGKSISCFGWFLDENKYKNNKNTHNRSSKIKYNWYHKDGKIETLTISEMENKYNLTKGKASAVACGKQISCNNWYIDKEKYNNRKTNGIVDDKIYTFKKDNIVLYKTQKEFREMFNYPASPISGLIKKRRKSYKGWVIIYA